MVLEAGKKYDIRFEYFQGGGAAAAKLLWSCSKVEREIIPASQLIPRAESGEKPAKK